MKTSISLFALILCVHFTFAQPETIKSNVDTLPIGELKFGLFGGILANTGRANSYQFGILSEYRHTSIFATEFELSNEYRTNDFSISGRGQKEEINLDFSINAKLYFFRKKNWYGKIGYYLNKHILDTKVSEYYFYSNNDTALNSGIQVGFGYNFKFNNRSIKAEPIFRYNKMKNYLVE